MCLGVGRNPRNPRHQFRPTGVQKRTEKHTSETPRFGSFGAREVSKNTPKITHRRPLVSAVLAPRIPLPILHPTLHPFVTVIDFLYFGGAAGEIIENL